MSYAATTSGLIWNAPPIDLLAVYHSKLNYNTQQVEY